MAAALISAVTPSGVPDFTGVVRRLCAELLRIAEANEIQDDEKLLHRLGQVVAWSDEDSAMRARAARLALACATRLGREPAVQAYQRIVEGGQESDDPESRLRRVERDLRAFPFEFADEPDPALAEQSIRTDLSISRAELLMDLKRVSEAEALTRRILSDTAFPRSGVSEDAWIVTDGQQRWRLYRILGGAAMSRGDTKAAQTRFCEALDVLWHELDFWELDSALQNIAQEVYWQDHEGAALAMEVSVRIARLCQDAYAELYALEWKLEYGGGTLADVEKAQDILEDLQLDPEEQQRHLETLQRLQRHAR